MRRVLLVLLAVLLVAGCGGDDDAEEEVVVSAATSLTAAFEDYGGARFSFAGSDELAAQIRQGVTPDVYAAANTSLPRDLFEEELVEEPVVFAGNRLVLAVPADGEIASLQELAADGVTIAIGSEDVPIGSYTREVLARLPDEDGILDNVRSLEPDVGGIVGKLTQGAVDAGFVYATDVDATQGELEAIELPEDVAPVVEYGVAVVKGADNPEGGQAFVDGLLDGAGARALTDAGFTTP